MLAFTTPTTQSSLVIKRAAYLSARERVHAANTASQILPRLYLTNLFVAQDVSQLDALGVTHVVSVLENPPKLPARVRQLHVPIEDTERADMLRYLQQTTEWIARALQEDERNVVLVHCFMGVSRSATVVAAYLIATTPMYPRDAIEYIRARRGVVCPNPGFCSQLDAYAARYYGKEKKPKVARMGGHVVERMMFWRPPPAPTRGVEVVRGTQAEFVVPRSPHRRPTRQL